MFLSYQILYFNDSLLSLNDSLDGIEDSTDMNEDWDEKQKLYCLKILPQNEAKVNRYMRIICIMIFRFANVNTWKLV